MNAVAAPRPKPSKPRANFPLFPHPNGQWCKKINGKPRHFGSWRSDPTGGEAERRYKEERRDWEDGRNPRINAQVMSLMELAGRWLVERLEDARRGDISAKSYDGSGSSSARPLRRHAYSHAGNVWRPSLPALARMSGLNGGSYIPKR